MPKHGFVLAAFLSSILLEAAVAINRTDFFGEFVQGVTSHLVANDDDSSLAITLSVPYPFFDTPRSTIYVNNNGALTFASIAPSYNQMVFPNNPLQLIAQYWADADTHASGNVWFFETTDQALRDKATRYIRRGFVTERDFQPTHLFIATWDRVGYYQRQSDKTNTFQCILATDSVDLYVIFPYADIQWTTGTGARGGLGGNPAQVGFNAGDGRNSYSVPGSRTDDIVNIDELSNIGERGVWVFHVSGPQVRSGGCSDRENSLTLFPSHGNILGGETISVAGPCFDPNTRIQCVFEDTNRSAAIYVSQQEVLCVTPRLPRSGTLNLRILVDGSFKAQGKFTSISVEKAYQVDVTTLSETVTLSADNTIELQWDPLTIFPQDSSSDFQVTISMYTLNLENEELELVHRFTSNSPNDGQELVVIPNNLESLRNVEILPVLFLVSASVSPVSRAQSGELYTELVSSGQRAGRWSSQYYYINPSVANRTGYYECQAWYEGESENIGMQLLERSMPCPPQEEQARAPNSGLVEIDYTSFYGSSLYRTQWLNTFHQDATTCFGSGDLRSSLSSSAQECCYDGSGQLLTGAPGGGSVHKTPLAKSRVGHFREDTRPYLLCCTGYAPSCHKYYERRPSDNGSRYQPQRTAWMFGDPHLVTLDGFQYTFNGKGEFTLIATRNDLFTMQGRMEQFGSMPATVLTAIAAKELYSDTVMIANSRRRIDAYINGERVDLSVIKQQEFRNVSVVRENNSTIAVEFSCGARISVQADNSFLSAISVVLPPSFKGNTKGLLGVYNGNSNDDLLPQNGISPLASDTSNQRIHELFGLTWILSSDRQSLFTYFPYESFHDFHDPGFTPVFSVDSNSTNVSMCDGNEFCIFDVVTTNDSRVGVATLDAARQIDDTVQRSYPVVCEPACLNGACVANNTCRCSAGYTGSRCDSVDNPLSCDLNPCASGERCAILAGSYVCTPGCSRDPTTSPLCGVLAAGPCIVNHCNNGGICRPNNSISPYEFECICRPNYTGRLCDLEVSACTINPCLNGGSCSERGETDFTCSCLSGFSGKRCETAEGLDTTIIIIAACAGAAVLLVLIVVVICIIIFRVCTKKLKNGISFGSVEDPSGTLQKEYTDAGDHRHRNGTSAFSSREGSSTPANGVLPHNHDQPSDHQLSANHYQEPGSCEHIYHQLDHQLEKPHDQSPPPPYPEYEVPDWQHVRQHNNNSNQPLSYPVQRVQSDSSTINHAVNSGSDSTRSNTTSPNYSEDGGDRGSIKRTESLHKSNRSLKTPSPSPGMHQSYSYSNQSIPMRSSASTPAGYQTAVKKNYSLTLPHGMNGRHYLSSSTSQISKMRRHSSSNYKTSVTDDGSGNLTFVTEV